MDYLLGKDRQREGASVLQGKPEEVREIREVAVATDMTEDVVRAVALPTGWVDVKVCAVSEVWSGLRCVRRKELRAPKR